MTSVEATISTNNQSHESSVDNFFKCTADLGMSYFIFLTENMDTSIKEINKALMPIQIHLITIFRVKNPHQRCSQAFPECRVESLAVCMLHIDNQCVKSYANP